MRLLKTNNWKHISEDSACFQLSNNKIHIWSASLKQPAEDTRFFLQILSSDEQARAKRFYFERDEKRYIAGRGMLRILLGNYIGVEPAQIKFIYNFYGKPALAPIFNTKNLQFNLSHSKDQAVYAFNWDEPIGVDIEYIQPMKDMDDLASQFFTSGECALIHSLAAYQKQETFFKIWTCKEAYLKANGSGLTVPINQVEVSFLKDGAALLTSIGGNKEQAAQWHMSIFTPIKGYQAAHAIKRHKKHMVYQQINCL